MLANALGIGDPHRQPRRQSFSSRRAATKLRPQSGMRQADGVERGLVDSAIHVTSGTNNSTNVRLTRQRSALFQWLAVPLWFPADKNSVPTDSGIPFECFSTRRPASSPALGGLTHKFICG